MAFRTTAIAVGKIIEVDASIDLDPFIETANALVTELCVPSGYNAARLELIERWLSAHFYAVRESRAASEGAGAVSVSYQNAVDLDLKCTMYGQQAMLLDTAGGLAGLNLQSKGGAVPHASVTWLGTKTTDPWYGADEEVDP